MILSVTIAIFGCTTWGGVVNFQNLLGSLVCGSCSLRRGVFLKNKIQYYLKAFDFFFETRVVHMQT